ncbi:class I tRNA ligase family protein [Klebsiella pneumoniae]|nr:class I tRNA ligase family protein [Klebsiella pneumoniae]
MQRLMRFCSIEMGSFYLDIIKDRQYTAKADSVARRSCQTALFHIVGSAGALDGADHVPHRR